MMTCSRSPPRARHSQRSSPGGGSTASTRSSVGASSEEHKLSLLFYFANIFVSYAPGGHHPLCLEDLVAAPGAALVPLHPLLLVRDRGMEVNQGPGLLILARPDDDAMIVMMIMMIITCQGQPGPAHCHSPRTRIHEAQSSWHNKVCRKSPRQENRNK